MPWWETAHIQVSPAVCGGDQQRDWHKVRAPTPDVPKIIRIFPLQSTVLGRKRVKEGRSVKEETALLEVVLTLTEDLPK